MNNIKEIIVSLKTRVALAELIGPDEMIVSASDLSALIAQLESAQKERDALREVHIGAGSNTRAAADIYFQLVEELEVPAGGSLVGVIDNLKAELSAANEKLSKPVVLPEVVVVNISGKYPIEVMYASKVKTFLKAAGFTAEGE
ncbi:TPA: hypothetical protein ACPZLZ_003955 [Yersinia enterocolitica]|nr:hypothetical protein [Yersinia enterocolitica]EKN6110541.1 hypothetical protein [Yersinia enterocolitica]EKN6142590.1 hypothetical protein [Yersinia enterocolitica]